MPMERDLHSARTRRADVSRWKQAPSEVEESIEVQRGTKYIFSVQYIVPRWIFMYLWIAPAVIQAGLAAMMIHRKLAGRFPAFFIYTVYEVVLCGVLVTLDVMDSVSGSQYANAYLVGAVISAALRFAVVYEVFGEVFRSYPALQEFGGILFRWATAILMIVAVIMVAYSSGTEMDKFNIAFIIVERTVNIIQCGLLVFLVLLARFLSFSWTSYVMGITLGFGVFSSVQLGISALRAQQGLYFAWNTFPVVSGGVYHACVLLWVVTLLLPEYGSRRTSTAPVQELQHWNDALERVLHQ
jgi:hypothetical protein